ncbi:MAG: M23 family metallopeptidase [Dehalobacter sp.]|nr:M23 family metallopeptidase [Dehalobacter sp.]
MSMPVRNAKITNAYLDPKTKGDYKKTTVNPNGDHRGMDIIGTDGTYVPTYAAVAGTIIASSYDKAGWGNFVILRTTDGKYDLIYGHHSKVLVSQGTKVKAGQQLGVMGTSGNSTGIHLHFEVRKAPWNNQIHVSPATFLGIKNERGNVVSLPTATTTTGKTYTDVVLCNAGADERAAAYLADWLGTEIVLLSKASTIKVTGTAYIIGSSAKPFDNTVNIVGADRFDTGLVVLRDYCKKAIKVA